MSIPQNKQNANYTLVLSDNWKHIYHDDANTYTYTIPDNTSVAFPIWTAITFVNQWTWAITISITTDTLTFNDWTTSGHFVHEREINVSMFKSLLIDCILVSWFPSSFFPNPESPRIAKIKLLNSCPPGIP